MDTVLPSTTNDLLVADHVRKLYPKGSGDDLLVLDDVTLTLRTNEIVSLLGRSGSGKSSLLRIIAGLMPASSGTAVLTLAAKACCGTALSSTNTQDSAFTRPAFTSLKRYPSVSSIILSTSSFAGPLRGCSAFFDATSFAAASSGSAPLALLMVCLPWAPARR